MPMLERGDPLNVDMAYIAWLEDQRARRRALVDILTNLKAGGVLTRPDLIRIVEGLIEILGE